MESLRQHRKTLLKSMEQCISKKFIITLFEHSNQKNFSHNYRVCEVYPQVQFTRVMCHQCILSKELRFVSIPIHTYWMQMWGSIIHGLPWVVHRLPWVVYYFVIIVFLRAKIKQLFLLLLLRGWIYVDGEMFFFFCRIDQSGCWQSFF